MGQMKRTGYTRTGLAHVIIMNENCEEAHMTVLCVSVVPSMADIANLLRIPYI